MNKKYFTALSLSLIMLIGGTAAGCSSKETTPKEYTVQYTDDAGTHQITVTDKMPYMLEAVPERFGYTFTGLFDAEEGGTQYVSANGASVAPFTAGKNMVLFPQYEAKEYTLVLDYQGGTVTGERQLKVNYGSALPQLPTSSQLEHNDFSGWYTAENCKGTQIADKYGLIPVVSVVNESNFDLSGEYIYLYAGFRVQKFEVTLCFGDNIENETMQVEYGTPVSQIIPQTRVGGCAVLNWSQTRGGDIFNGEITSNSTLYAVDFAPVIDFDSNGGDSVTPIVARAGSSVILPEPKKDLAKFLHWEDLSGKVYNSSVMPEKSISLTAVWQAKIVFDSNGGTRFDDMSNKAGTAITLPTPEKEGYVFAGWYTADKQQYTTKSMPATGIALKAGWYKAKNKIKTFLDKNSFSKIVYYQTPMLQSAYNINFAEEISEVDWNKKQVVKLNFYADFKHVRGEVENRESEDLHGPDLYATKEHFYFYSQPQVVDAYLIDFCLADHGNGSINAGYTSTNFSISLEVTSGIVYTALGADKDSDYYSYGWHYGSGWRMTNFWVEIEYPDTAQLYL